MFARLFIEVEEPESSDSRMQLCKSSSMSLCFSAKEAVFMLAVWDALRCVKRLMKRIRTSNGSAIYASCVRGDFNFVLIAVKNSIWRSSFVSGNVPGVIQWRLVMNISHYRPAVSTER